jgi:hypothetical protein
MYKQLTPISRGLITGMNRAATPTYEEAEADLEAFKQLVASSPTRSA